MKVGEVRVETRGTRAEVGSRRMTQSLHSGADGGRRHGLALVEKPG